MAMAMVSRSRISPTSTMSGSSRRADRSARLNVSVCTPTCRCVMTHFLFSCTNSIGSSIVMMWSVRVRLIRATAGDSEGEGTGLDANVPDTGDAVLGWEYNQRQGQDIGDGHGRSRF